MHVFKQSKKYNLNELVLENKSTILLGFLSFLFAIFFKKVFFISLFIILDLTNSWANSKFKISLPLDFLFIGLILFSTKYEFYSGMIFIPFIIFNKLVMGKLEFIHFLKVPILILVAFIAPFLAKISITISIIIILIVRYAFEYIIAFFIFREFDVKKIPRRLYNFIGMYTFFVVFGLLLIKLI